MIKLKQNWHWVFAFLIFCLPTIWLFWPTFANFSNYLFGYHNDAAGILWYLWNTKQDIIHFGPFLSSSYIAAPFGVSTPNILLAIAVYLPEAIIAIIFKLSEISAYNSMVFLSFPLAGLGMYSLVYYFTKNKIASFIAGLIFAFSPYHITQAQTTIDLPQIQWFPFYLLFLFKFWKNPNWKNLLGLAIFFWLNIFTNPYYLVFTYLIGLIFILFQIYFSKDNLWPKINKKIKILLLILFLLPTCLLLALFFYLTRKQGMYLPPLEDLVQNSAKIQYYFLPSVHHPFFGQWLGGKFPGFNFTAQTIYLGVVPLVLALLALLYSKIRSINKKIIYFFGMLGLIGIIFSLPWWPAVGLNKLFPFLRAITRFGLWPILAISVLAGFTIFYLSEKTKGGLKYFIFAVILIFVGFEFLPDRPISKLNYLPPEYQWLKEQKEDFIFKEYPYFLLSSPSQWLPLYYQTIHQKESANTYSNRPTSETALRFYMLTSNLEEIQSVPLLKMLGVKYLVTHKDAAEAMEKPIVNDFKKKLKTIEANPNLEIKQVFPDSEILAIKNTLPKIFVSDQVILAPGDIENFALGKINKNKPVISDLSNQEAIFFSASNNQSKNQFLESMATEIFTNQKIDFRLAKTDENNSWEIKNSEPIGNTPLLTTDKPGAKISYAVNLDYDGDYSFYLRLLKKDNQSVLGYQIKNNDRVYQGDYQVESYLGEEWKIIDIKLGDFPLQKGKVEINLTNLAGENAFESLRLDSEQNKNSSLKKPNIDFQKINGKEYRIEIQNAQAPFLLNLLGVYDPSWQALVENQKIPEEKHFKIFDYANSWYVDHLGNYQIVLKYK